MSEGRKMPKYRSHKVVSALKIAKVEGFILFFEGDDYPPVQVPADYITKHAPQPGGYYVLYEDGYASWSPAEAFEDGYRRIDQEPPLTSDELDELTVRFTYHPPKPGQPEKYELIREEAKELALTIAGLAPESGERNIALGKLDEVVMWANAAIARRE